MTNDYFPAIIGGTYYHNEKDWTMTRATKSLSPGSVKYIILHCSGTRSDRRYTAADCERDHISRGFICGGYHLYVEQDGRVTQMRPFTQVGAHCRPWNSCSVGICYEGGLDGRGLYANTMTPAQRDVILSYLIELLVVFPEAKVRGHRDMPGAAKKACPCLDVREEFPELEDFM